MERWMRFHRSGGVCWGAVTIYLERILSVRKQCQFVQLLKLRIGGEGTVEGYFAGELSGLIPPEADKLHELLLPIILSTIGIDE